MSSVHCTHMSQLNVVIENFDGGVSHMKETYDAEFLMDIPRPEWHGCLLETGRVIFQLLAPSQFLLNSRYGPHFLGVKFQVENMEAARAAVAERGIRIVRDIKVAFHTDPRDCYGVAFEFWDGDFREMTWELLGGRTMRPVEYWRDEHALGLIGYKGLSIAVEDASAARNFLQSFVGAEPMREAARTEIGAQAITLQLADGELELLAPSGKGAINSHLIRHGQGIRAAILGVRSVDQARRYFADRGVPTIAGDRPGSIAVPAEHNCGVIFEFAE